MKWSRRALTAASLLSLAALPVLAAEVTFTYGGQGHLSGYWIDQDELPTNDINNFGFAGEGRVWGRANWVADNGMEYGGRAQLRFQSSEAEFSNDFIRGAPDFVDEVWIYLQTAFGRLTLGLEDGAGDSAGIYSPTVSEVNRIDDARHYPVQDPTMPSFAAAFSPNGAHLRTDLNGSGDAFKIIYYSPRLIGIQISASYTPELTRGLNDLFDGDGFDEQSDIWEVGLNYQGTLSGFDVGFYAGYVVGYNDRPSTVILPVFVAPGVTVASTAFTPDDLEEWGTGAQIAYEGFKLGGSYRLTNIAGGAGLADKPMFGSISTGCSQIAGCVLPGKETEIWGAGIAYETGPWRFGAGYVTLEQELPNTAASSSLTQDAQGWTGAIGYEFDENVQIVTGYQHYDYDGPAGVCIAAGCDKLDADLAYLQTSITF